MKSGKVDEELLEIAEEAAMNVADMDVPLRAYLRAAIAAVAPLIAAAERERCAKVAEACRLPSRLVDGGPMAGWQTFPHEWPQTIAAAIRALD